MNREEKRLDLAVEAVKQQITLATAIIGASLAFSSQLSGVKQGKIWDLLPFAFAPLALSIICGVLALMSIAFHLSKDGDPLNKRGVRQLGMVQNLGFLLSVIIMVFIVAYT
jgi:hypothetical protein